MSACTAPGTHAGLNRHRRAWEQPCSDCAAFQREYARNRRATNPKAREQYLREGRIQREAVRLLIAKHRGEYRDLLRQARERAS